MGDVADHVPAPIVDVLPVRAFRHEGIVNAVERHGVGVAAAGYRGEGYLRANYRRCRFVKVGLQVAYPGGVPVTGENDRVAGVAEGLQEALTLHPVPVPG